MAEWGELDDARPCAACGTTLAPYARSCAACAAAVGPPPPVRRAPRWRRGLARLQAVAFVVGLVSTTVGLWSLVTGAGATVEPARDPIAPATTTATSGAVAPGSVAPTTTTTVASAAGTAACASTAFGYALTYPDDWSTAARDDSESCRYFHPEPFEIPADVEVAEVAIVVEPLAVDYDDWIAANEQTGIVVLARDDMVVAGGARAVRLVLSFPEGSEDASAVVYAVDRGVDVLVFFAFRPLSPDPARTEAVLDAMVASLELFG